MIAGVLDLGKGFDGCNPTERIAATVTLAQHSEAAGLRSYWLGEHHVPSAAFCAPEILVAVLASHTERLHIGHAGVLLRYYSPLKVAEVYLTLEAAFPGRIDLGLCRGPGVVDEAVALDLVWGNAAELEPVSLERKIDELVAFYGPASRSTHPGPGGPFPDGVAPPSLSILGTSARSVDQAVRHQLPYGLMLFQPSSGQWGPPLMARYRERASEIGFEPIAAIAVSVLCGESVAAARRDNEQLARVNMAHNIVGTPESCAHAMLELADAYGAERVVAATFSRQVADHERLVEALAALTCLRP